MLPQNAGHPDPASNPSPRRQPAPASMGPIAGRVGAAPAPRPPLPAKPPALSGPPDLGALARALKRRWLLALALAVALGGAVGGGLYVLLAPKHSAVAQLKIASRVPAPLLGNDRPDGRQEFDMYVKSQLGQLKSRYVLNAAYNREEVKKLNLDRRYPDPVSWMDEELKIDLQPGSELVPIRFSADDPDEAKVILNAITQAYYKEVVEKDEAARSAAVAQIEKTFRDNDQALTSKRATLKTLAENLDHVDSETARIKHQALMQALSAARAQLSTVSFQLLAARGRLDTHKASESQLANLPVPEAAINQAIDADPLVRADIEKIQQLRDYRKSISDTIQDPNSEPRFKLAGSRLSDLESKLEQRRQQLRREYQARGKTEARAGWDARLSQFQNELAPLAAQEAALKAEAKRLENEAQKLGRGTAEYDSLKSEVARATTLVEKLGDRLEESRLSLLSKPRVTIYQDAAAEPLQTKKQLLGTVLGGGAAVFGCCLAVAWFEFRRRRIQSAEEVSAGLGIRVVGAVPASADVERILTAPAGQNEQHLLHESIDALRTLLLAGSESARVLMVTSAESGEAKTMLASHLASSLARAGRKTLLIDGDLRQPALHQLFEINQQPGLSEVLLGEVDTVDAIVPGNVDGLMLMAAGQWDREVLQSLARGCVPGVLEKLKEEFDFVVIDSHPVLPATDSLLIGQHVDAVLLSVFRDVSQSPRVYAAAQRLGGVGIRVLGAVVSGTDPHEVYCGSTAATVAA